MYMYKLQTKKQKTKNKKHKIYMHNSKIGVMRSLWGKLKSFFTTTSIDNYIQGGDPIFKFYYFFYPAHYLLIQNQHPKTNMYKLQTKKQKTKNKKQKTKYKTNYKKT